MLLHAEKQIHASIRNNHSKKEIKINPNHLLLNLHLQILDLRKNVFLDSQMIAMGNKELNI